MAGCPEVRTIVVRGRPAPARLCTPPLACKLHALTMSCRSVAPLCGDVLPLDTGKVTAWPVPKRMAMSRIRVAFEESRPSLPQCRSHFFGACSGRRFPVRTRAAMCMPQPADHAEAAPRSVPRQTYSSDIWLQTSGVLVRPAAPLHDHAPFRQGRTDAPQHPA